MSHTHLTVSKKHCWQRHNLTEISSTVLSEQFCLWHKQTATCWIRQRFDEAQCTDCERYHVDNYETQRFNNNLNYYVYRADLYDLKYTCLISKILFIEC